MIITMTICRCIHVHVGTYPVFCLVASTDAVSPQQHMLQRKVCKQMQETIATDWFYCLPGYSSFNVSLFLNVLNIYVYVYCIYKEAIFKPLRFEDFIQLRAGQQDLLRLYLRSVFAHIYMNAIVIDLSLKPLIKKCPMRLVF